MSETTRALVGSSLPRGRLRLPARRTAPEGARRARARVRARDRGSAGDAGARRSEQPGRRAASRRPPSSSEQSARRRRRRDRRSSSAASRTSARGSPRASRRASSSGSTARWERSARRRSEPRPTRPGTTRPSTRWPSARRPSATRSARKSRRRCASRACRRIRRAEPCVRAVRHVPSGRASTVRECRTGSSRSRQCSEAVSWRWSAASRLGRALDALSRRRHHRARLRL